MRSGRGFTLLETLVAIAILGMGIASVMQVIGASARAADRTQAVTRGVFVAEELMEELTTLNESALRDRARETGDYAEHEARAEQRREGRPPDAGRAGGATRYRYAISVTPERAEAGLYRVDVEVTWPEARSGSVQLSTLRRFPTQDTRERLP
jgi:prepilin-type N-terminal cleavage/methylation domain-containing protein